jgi:hypothetical protein
MTGEGEVSRWRGSNKRRYWGPEIPTANNAGLQRSLVTRLRGALLLEYFLEVVVYESLGALGYGGSHLLQTRRHGVLPLRFRGLTMLEVGREALPEVFCSRTHLGLDISGNLFGR